MSRRLPRDQQMMACLFGQAGGREEEGAGTCHPQPLPWCHLLCHLTEEQLCPQTTLSCAVAASQPGRSARILSNKLAFL